MSNLAIQRWLLILYNHISAIMYWLLLWRLLLVIVIREGETFRKLNFPGLFDWQLNRLEVVLFVALDGQWHHRANLQAVVLLRVWAHTLALLVVAVLGLVCHYERLLVWIVEYSWVLRHDWLVDLSFLGLLGSQTGQLLISRQRWLAERS